MVPKEGTLEEIFKDQPNILQKSPEIKNWFISTK